MRTYINFLELCQFESNMFESIKIIHSILSGIIVFYSLPVKKRSYWCVSDKVTVG